MLHFEPDRLRSAVRRILEAGGSRQDEAEVVADHLVLANQSGHDSHGVGMIPAYVKNLSKDLLVPNETPELVNDTGSILVFDGRRGYGQSIGRQAMRLAIERCREHGVVLMTAAREGVRCIAPACVDLCKSVFCATAAAQVRPFANSRRGEHGIALWDWQRITRGRSGVVGAQ